MKSFDEQIRERLAQAPVIPLIMAEEPAQAVAIGQALVAGGLSVLEVVLRTPEAMSCMAAAAESIPGALVGAGTVLSPDQAHLAVEQGARFLVSPGFDPTVVEAAQSRGCPIFPGVQTGSEIQQARNMGLKTLKFFPASLSGGPAMLKALGAAFRDIDFIPTGGISEQNLAEYVSLPNVLACGGSWLTPRALVDAADFDQITSLCERARAIAQRAGE